jgi:hypothetical protein
MTWPIEIIKNDRYNELSISWSGIYMSQHAINRIGRLDVFILLPILVLAFFVAFIPHLGYPYPVHIDEWMHLAYTNAVMEAGDTTYIDPFYGEAVIGLTGLDLGVEGSHLEIGFYVFWGIFHQISGLSWLTIFKYFPAIIFMFTVLSVYVLTRREGFGWEAALCTCLMLTTVGILGPGFLIPVTTGLLFIPLALFVAFSFRSIWAYLVIFLFTCFLLILHGATAVGLVIVFVPYILLNIKGDFKHSLGLTLALVVPFLAPFPWIFNMLLPIARTLLSPQPLVAYVDLPRLFILYGYLPTVLCILGTLWLVIKGDRKSYGLVLGLLALLVMLVMYFTFHYGVPLIYYRGLLYTMLMMGITAGAALMALRKLRIPERFTARLKVPIITKHAGLILCLAVVGLTLVLAIPSRLDIPYYHMIDEQDYEAFVWIKENIDDSYGKAILDPWKATAYTAITGKPVYSRLHSYPKEKDQIAYEFLRNGCLDTTFLKEEGISIVYSRLACNNTDLTAVRENIYILKEKE